MTRKGSNAGTLRSVNRALILNLIRRQPVSRAQLSRETGMSKAAVTMITNSLIAEGQLREIGKTVTGRGRNPVLLDIVPDYRYVAGIVLHRRRLMAVITDLRAGRIDRMEEKTGHFSDPAAAAAWICKSIRRLMRRNGIGMESMAGIGISSPGPLDDEGGVILNPPNFSLFANVPIVSWIRREFPLPVFLENNSVLLAMLEYDRGTLKDYRNSLFVILSDGIGSCLIRDGQVYRGYGGHAGELGHISIDIEGPECPCGNAGCLELYATMSAIKARFGFSDYEKVVDDAYAGRPYALDILDYQARRLACGLVSAANLFDLDSIMLYGEFNYRSDLLRSMIAEILNSRSMINRVHRVDVLFSRPDKEEEAVSSAAAVIARHFSQQL